MLEVVIALLGNINHNLFSLARHLRDEGYDVKLFYFDEQPQFMPKEDTWHEHDLSITQHLEWYSKSILNVSSSEIEKLLGQAKFIIACDEAPAFLAKASINIDLLIPAGGEIWNKHKYNFQLSHIINPKLNAWRYVHTYFYRKAFGKMKNILFMPVARKYEEVYNTIPTKAKRLSFASPMLYTPSLICDFDDEQLRRLKELCSYKFIVYQHVRQEIKSPNSVHYKGNERLIKGFKEFNLLFPDSLLILLEYGSDVVYSKELIDELNLQQAVYWLPKSTRKVIYNYLKFADVCIGDLGNNWMLYGSLYEYLSAGKLVIHNNMNWSSYAFYDTKYNWLQAEDATQVCSHLTWCYNNRDELKSLGEYNAEWYQKYCVSKPLSVIKDLISKEIEQD